MKIRRSLLAVFLVTLAPAATTFAQSPAAPMGTWTGTAYQNKGASNYTVVMTISASGAETDYPELKCGGKLTRVGASGGYFFFVETIVRGGRSTGGSCIDGTIGGADSRQARLGLDGKLARGHFCGLDTLRENKVLRRQTSTARKGRFDHQPIAAAGVMRSPPSPDETSSPQKCPAR
jgi:hypothetical protein